MTNKENTFKGNVFVGRLDLTFNSLSKKSKQGNYDSSYQFLTATFVATDQSVGSEKVKFYVRSEPRKFGKNNLLQSELLLLKEYINKDVSIKVINGEVWRSSLGNLWLNVADDSKLEICVKKII